MLHQIIGYCIHKYIITYEIEYRKYVTEKIENHYTFSRRGAWSSIQSNMYSLPESTARKVIGFITIVWF